MTISIADRLSATKTVNVFPGGPGDYDDRSQRQVRQTLLAEAQGGVRFLVQAQADEVYGSPNGEMVDTAMASPIPPYPNCWMEWDVPDDWAARFGVPPVRAAVRVHTFSVDEGFAATKVRRGGRYVTRTPETEALAARIGVDRVVGATVDQMDPVADATAAWEALGVRHALPERCDADGCPVDRLSSWACATYPAEVTRRVADRLRDRGCRFYACFHPVLGPKACDRTVWDLAVYVGFFMGPLGQVVGGVDTHGEINRKASRWNQATSDRLRAKFEDTAFVMCLPAVYATSLLNCKNVGADPAPFDGKASRRWAVKARGRPLFHWKVLRVTPMQPRRSREAGEPDPDRAGTMPLYDVRRHMKDYRQGKGLFGKHHGLFLYEAHTAGNPAVGRVEKDYEVKRPHRPEGSE